MPVRTESGRERAQRLRELAKKQEADTRPLLTAMVQDVAALMGITSEDEQTAADKMVRRANGDWVSKAEGEFSYEDLPKAFCVFREGLFDNPEVSVRIGPVVGKVTDTVAVILVEMDTACDLVVNVARVHAAGQDPRPAPGPWPLATAGTAAIAGAGPGGAWAEQAQAPAAAGLRALKYKAVGSLSVCHSVEARRPYTFVFEGLLPDTSYVVLLSNVCREDLDRRVARFRTLPSIVESLRFVALAGHQPPLRAVGTANPWQRLLELAQAGPDVSLTLHLGSLIDAVPVGEEVVRILTDLQAYTKGARQDLERKARDALRAGFWDAWGRHEPLRRVLAEVGSHIPLFAPPIDPGVLRPAEGVVGADEDRQAVLRVGLQAYREYQRSLWHASSPEGRPDVRIDGRDDAVRMHPGMAMHRVVEPRPHHQEFWTASGTKSASTVEEWHVHRYGNICVLALDTKGSFLNGNKPTTLMSALQRKVVGEVLQDSLTRVLVLASDIPFVLDENTEYAGAVVDEDLPLTWSAYPAELQGLLEKLFSWKQKKYPAREVLLVSGGLGFGTTGDICDHKLGLNIPAVITGPTLGRVCSPLRWQLKNVFAAGRFSYLYRNPVARWNFTVVDIDLSGKRKRPSVEVQMVDVEVPPGTEWPDGGMLHA